MQKDDLLTTPESVESLRLTRHRSFILFWVSRVFSAVGFQMSSVALGWLVYDKTGSAYDLGLVGLTQFVPMALLTFLVGHAADRFDRRRIVVLCHLVQCATLGLLTIGIVTHELGLTAIFCAVAVLGAARAFESPTMTALLPVLVPIRLLHQAIAISTSAMQTATIVGPSLGGLLYVAGADFPFGLAALLLLCAALSMMAIKLERQAPRREPVTLRSVFSGVSFIFGRPIVLGTISLDLFAVLLGGVTALMPIFARDILHTGPWGLGLLRSAPAVGALAMSLVLARFSLGRAVGLKMFASVMVFGLATIVFSASVSLPISLVALLALGAADNVSVVIRNSLVQLSTPDGMRGRVNAVNSLFIGTSNQLGDFESGMVAGLLGAVPAGILGGVGTVLVALLWMRLFPTLRDVQSLSFSEPAVLDAPVESGDRGSP
jgi:MFS family permease